MTQEKTEEGNVLTWQKYLESLGLTDSCPREGKIVLGPSQLDILRSSGFTCDAPHLMFMVKLDEDLCVQIPLISEGYRYDNHGNDICLIIAAQTLDAPDSVHSRASLHYNCESQCGTLKFCGAA